MAKRPKRDPQSDAYSRMYESQLERFQNMADDGYDDGGQDDLHFYTEEELEAIEQAKRDAARQAYQDAYLEEYNKVKGQQQQRAGGQRRRAQAQPQRRQAPQQQRQPQRRVSPSSQRLAQQARQKHSNEPMQFGRQNEYTNSKKGKRGVKGGSAVGSFFKGLFIILLVIVLLIQLLIFRYISMVNAVETGRRMGIEASLDDAAVTNMLLIGTDTRDEEERGRTDSMILLSINTRSKEIVQTSMLRDCYVEVPGYGWNKLNAAYAYGGAELLMDTIELNFDVRVDKYVLVSFFSFIDIVDAVGGIELDISDEEAIGMTDPMAEQNKYLGNPSGTDYLTSGGKGMKVNGNQALAYARLRYVGNADFERTSRQRTVMVKILEKAKTLSPLKLDNFLKVTASELTTNMNRAEMYFMFYRLLFSLKYDMQQVQIPPEDGYYYGSHDGQSTLDVDFDMAKRELQEKVYK